MIANLFKFLSQIDSRSHFNCTLCEGKLEVMTQSGNTTRKQYDEVVSDICQCTNCGHVQFYPLPKSDVLDNYYSSNYFYESIKIEPDVYYNQWFDEEDLSHALFIQSLSQIKLENFQGTENPTLYDYGCGYGGLIAKTVQLGFNSRGSDLDETCIAYCMSKGLSASIAGIQFLAKETNLDVITCYHSLEHFLDPKDFFLAANSALNSNGFLFLAFPNGGYYPAQKDSFGKFDWCFFPEHLHYFTPSSIQNILIKNNFEVISMKSNSVAESQLEWLQKSSLASDCDVSIIDLDALYRFHDNNLSSRDLRVIARKISPES